MFSINSFSPDLSPGPSINNLLRRAEVGVSCDLAIHNNIGVLIYEVIELVLGHDRGIG